MKHYIFGSKSSRDYDILVLVDNIPNIAECKKLCEGYDKYFAYHYPDKPVNVNIGVINTIKSLAKVYKGTADEVNNSVCATYNLHEQKFPLELVPVNRDVDLKVIRAVRIILGFLSRTQYRKEVKDALFSEDIDLRLKTLKSIDLTTITDFGKNESLEEICKTIAFQIGQTWSLVEGREVYTKEDIAKPFPSLDKFLKRTSTDLKVLNTLKDHFVMRIEEFRPYMHLTKEEHRK